MQKGSDVLKKAKAKSEQIEKKGDRVRNGFVSARVLA